MRIGQISVFIENRVGRIKEITEVLGRSNINIRALSLADTSDFGILRMIVDQREKALKVLREKGFIVKDTDVVVVEVPDRPGGLAKVLGVLTEALINVEYMYAFFEKPEDKALLIFRFEDPDTAISVLTKKGVQVLSAEALGVS